MSWLVLLFILVAPARALDWWVPTEADATGVREALAVMWAGAAIEVRVGPWPGFGVGSDAARLWVVAEGVDRDEAAPADPVLRVVLLRAWLRVPPRPVVAATVPVAPRPPAPTRDRWSASFGALVGPGFGVSGGAPPVTAELIGAAGWRQLIFGVGVDGGFGGLISSVPDEEPLRHQRGGLVVLVGLRAPLWGGELDVTAGGGLRAWTLTHEGGDSRWSTRLGLAERISWWRSVSPGWDFGLALRVDLDDPAGAGRSLYMRTPDGYRGRVPPAQVALEVGMRHAWSP